VEREYNLLKDKIKSIDNENKQNYSDRNIILLSISIAFSIIITHAPAPPPLALKDLGLKGKGNTY
jgi:hypothetical protein